MGQASFTPVLGLPVAPLDVIENVLLAVHRKGLPSNPSDPQGADGVLIDCEALFQGMRSHILIKDVTSSEVENTTVVLIFGDQPDIDSPVWIFVFIILAGKLANTHELCLTL